jgi:diacylglycerol kinase (ATP)
MRAEILERELPAGRIPLQRGKMRVILNPASGGGRTRRKMNIILNALRREFGADLHCNITRTTGEAEILSRKAARAGCEIIIAVGGDGTIQEVVNGLFEDGQPVNPECRLGIISSGTANGFPLSLRLPKTLDGQIQCIRNNRAMQVDIGRITHKTIKGFTIDRYFINECQIGIGSEVVKRMQKNQKHPDGALVLGGVAVRVALQYREPLLRVKFDGTKEIEDRIVGIVVGNGSYIGGGINLVPGANVSDGWFNVMIIHAQSVPRRLMTFQKIYSGTHVRSAQFSFYKAKHITVESLERVDLEADGELLGYPPSTIKMYAGAVNVIC